MTDLERIWRERNDPLLLEAAENLDDYTEEGRRVILAEIARRGLKMPRAEQGEEEPPDGPAPAAAAPVLEDLPVEGPLACLRCGLELQFAGARSLRDAGAGIFAELAPLLENSQRVNVYVCPQCGHVDLFAEGNQEDEEAAP
jgi:hypothetical protein